MDQRSATAPPLVDRAAVISQESHLQKDKRLRNVSGNQCRTPDSIEEAVASLFTRVRALINEPYPIDDNTTALENFSQSHGYSTSSYDADEGTTSSSMSTKPVNQHELKADNFYQLSSFSSMGSSFGELVRIQTVPKHSVTSSIVRNDSPMPAHYLHSSNPTNINKRTAGDRTPKLALSRITPSTELVVVTETGKKVPGHHSQSSTPSARKDSGFNPEKIRIIYDSSSTRSPVTPANTVATPNPLISIIPPTPLVISPSCNSAGSTHNRERRHTNAYATSTVIAHTGASTPEESTIQTGNTSIGSPNTGKVIITNSEYDSGKEKKENGEEQYTLPEISSPITPPGRLPILPTVRNEVAPQQSPQNTKSYYTQEQMDELSAYSDSGTSIPVRGNTSRTLYEEYILSDPRRKKSKDHKNKTRPQSHHYVSRGRKEISVDQTILPMSTGSFTRIITDLEEMLNQALELAGRAVTDPHTALEQRDASIRNIRSLRESVVSDNDSIIGNAESFKTADDEKPEELSVNKQRDSRAAISRECHKLARGGSKMVSKSISKTFSSIGDSESVQGMRRTSPAEDNTRAQQPVIQRKIEKSHAEHSRIPRPSGKFTTSSTRSVKPYFQPGVGQDELLSRVSKVPTNDNYSGIFPTSIILEPGWDWGLAKKRFSAGVSCAVVVLIGLVVGCYDGEGEVIRKHLRSTTVVTSLGNVLFVIGVAIPSLLFWPLPLLHGRKPYLLLSIALTIPLQIPQALSLPPHTITLPERSMVPFTVCILVFRTLSGLVLGFASMNALATLVDLFGPDNGACCRGGVVFNSRTPVEGQDQFCLVPGGESGARVGVWLGVWTWLFFAFAGVGLFVGQFVVARSTPAWGPWTVAIVATVLVFFVWLIPEVRPPWKKQRIISHRRTGWRGKEELLLEGRGEIRMIIFGTPPKWWWEEVWAGMVLSLRMLKQLGFLVMTIYVGWVAGEMAVVFNLLVALISKHYKFTLIDTGLIALALSAGALVSAPAQFSSFYMRNFRHRVHHRGNPTQQQHHYHEGQHPYRVVFLIGLLLFPTSSLAFTISAMGPPTHFFIPVLLSGLIVFSGTLVITECHLIVMENFDISNIPEALLSSGSGSVSHGGSKGGRPHGTQRPTSLLGSNDDFTTCHPAITSAFGIFQFVSLVAVAGAVGWSRWVDEGVGIKNGLGIFTGVSFLVTIALAAVLWRWKEVRLLEVYTERNPEQEVEQTNTAFQGEIRSCKISVFQRGRFTRWSEVNEMAYRGDEEEDAWRVR